MNLRKNKVVFITLIVTIVVFIISYGMLLKQAGSKETKLLKQVGVPEINDTPEQYTERLDAVEALKEVSKSMAPSIYELEIMDSIKAMDPLHTEKGKKQLIDSVYELGKRRTALLMEHKDWSGNTKVYPKGDQRKSKESFHFSDSARTQDWEKIAIQQQSFFAKTPSMINREPLLLRVVVDGNQILKKDSRLRMRLIGEARIGDHIFSGGTPIYGFVKLAPNRVLVQINHIGGIPFEMEVVNSEDGYLGLYAQNNFRTVAKNALTQQAANEISIPGVPLLGRLKRIFQRDNSTIKVMIPDNYSLILRTYIDN